LIVCNVNSLFESTGKNDYRFPDKLRNFKPTSAPYFDERCGIIINDFTKLKAAIDEILINISNYKPMDFIIENLSLEKQAKELLSFFDIPEQKAPHISVTSTIGKDAGSFKTTFRGGIIYTIFLMNRKTNTLIKIIKKTLRKLLI